MTSEQGVTVLILGLVLMVDCLVMMVIRKHPGFWAFAAAVAVCIAIFGGVNIDNDARDACRAAGGVWIHERCWDRSALIEVPR